MSRFVRALCFSAALLSPVALLAADAPAIGSSAPGFTLPSQLDKPVSLSSFKGQWVVLYFYPKDMTSGCTLEAHNFQRDEAQYKALHAAVVGVSADTVDSHKQFCTKETLSFKLLADPDHKVIDAYGVPLMQHDGEQYAARQTFLISPEGKVVKFWPKVDPQGHSAEVLTALKQAEGK